ncbi:MAG: methyltransferase [Paludibacter sp.]
MKNQLKSLFTEHWKYLAVNAACELKLFDKIFDGQNTTEKLIINNNWNLRALVHLLVFLKDNEYLNEIDFTLALTEKGNLLREGNTDGLFYACLNWSAEHLTAWQNLDFTIRSGKSSFEKVYGQSFFNYLNEHPSELFNYHKAMFEYARDDYKQLPELINFGKHKSVMDVGGGYGAAIKIIAEKYPNVNCLLFDLDKVIQGVNLDKIEKIAGDFFVQIPYVSESIILSRILHDWDNTKAKQILKNCFEALPSGGTLYVIENCNTNSETELALLSLNMSVMCESHERTEKEYKELCFEIGFEYSSQVILNQLQIILIFQKP